MKNSYLKVFVDWGERYQKLSDAEFGRLMRAAIAYKGGNPVPELTGREELMWDGIKLDIDRDNEQYSAICEARSEAGRRGAETRWNNKCHNDDGKNSTSHLPYGKNSQDKDKDKDKDKDEEKKKRTKFAPPSVAQVSEYCLERQNGIDAQAFVDWYKANGWKVGKNPMKDWKAAVRTWEQRRKQDHVAQVDAAQKEKDQWDAWIRGDIE